MARIATMTERLAALARLAQGRRPATMQERLAALRELDRTSTRSTRFAITGRVTSLSDGTTKLRAKNGGAR